MQKFINSQLKKITLGFILLFNTTNIFPYNHTKSEFTEIACASLGMISGIAANNIPNQDSLQAAKAHILHDVISIIGDFITIYNEQNKNYVFGSKSGPDISIDNYKTSIFTWELLTFNTANLFADIRNYINLKKKRKIKLNNDPELEFEIEKEETVETNIQPHIIKILKLILPVIQGIARISATLENGNTKIDYLEHEKMHGIALIAMLTELLTKTENKSIQNAITIVIIFNAIKLYSTFSAYNKETKTLAQHMFNLMKQAQDDLSTEKQKHETDVTKLNKTLHETQRDFTQEANKIHAELDHMKSLLTESRNQNEQLNVRCFNLDESRNRAERTYQNALTVLEEEKKARERAESELQKSGENRRHELFGNIGKNATPKEIRAAYEALLHDNAIELDD